MQSMDKGQMKSYVMQRYPGCRVKCDSVRPHRNSWIYTLSITSGKCSENIVVKIARNFQPRQVAREYESLSRFYRGCAGKDICSPQPLFADPERGIIAMKHVQGTILSYWLHELRPASIDCINHAVDLSAAALAQYHGLFRSPDGQPLSVDCSAPEEDINRFLEESRGRIDDCNLRSRVVPFFDFTTWNMIVRRDPSGMRLFLIDFPRLDYVCTPHLDLARFRFGLELIKQFPPARFSGLSRWDLDQLFDRFLTGYCRRTDASLNEADLLLIGRARKAYLRRAANLARKGDCGWQPKLEQAYLQIFSRQWLDQKGVHSNWPAMSRAEKA